MNECCKLAVGGAYLAAADSLLKSREEFFNPLYGCSLDVLEVAARQIKRLSPGLALAALERRDERVREEAETRIFEEWQSRTRILLGDIEKLKGEVERVQEAVGAKDKHIEGLENHLIAAQAPAENSAGGELQTEGQTLAGNGGNLNTPQDSLLERVQEAVGEIGQEALRIVASHMVHPHRHDDGKTEINRPPVHDCTPYIGLQIERLTHAETLAALDRRDERVRAEARADATEQCAVEAGERSPEGVSSPSMLGYIWDERIIALRALARKGTK